MKLLAALCWAARAEPRPLRARPTVPTHTTWTWPSSEDATSRSTLCGVYGKVGPLRSSSRERRNTRRD